MYDTVDDEIELLAWGARAWAERTAAPYRWFDADLTGFCALASQKLFRLLTQTGHRPLLAACFDEHVFVVLPDLDLLVDVTASQFELPDVVILRYSTVQATADVPSWWKPCAF